MVISVKKVEIYQTENFTLAFPLYEKISVSNIENLDDAHFVDDTHSEI